jgi:hypothetical protein
VSFPATTGTANAVLFSLNGDQDIVLEEPFPVRVGGDVAAQSLWEFRRQDRRWWQKDEWKALFFAALSEASLTTTDMVLTLGWPTSWYLDDKDAIRTALMGEHKLKRAGRRRQAANLLDVRIMPQGLGLGCDMIFDAGGHINNPDLLKQKHLYVNVGSNNTNFIASQGLRVGQRSASRDFGSWTAVAELRQMLDVKAPGLKLSDHEIDEVLRTGEVYYDGQRLDLSAEVADIWHHLEKAVIAAMTQLYDEARQFQHIIFGGGCIHHIGAGLKAAFPWATLHPAPEFGEVSGYQKFAQRIANLLAAEKQ